MEYFAIKNTVTGKYVTKVTSSGRVYYCKGIEFSNYFIAFMYAYNWVVENGLPYKDFTIVPFKQV